MAMATTPCSLHAHAWPPWPLYADHLWPPPPVASPHAFPLPSVASPTRGLPSPVASSICGLSPSPSSQCLWAHANHPRPPWPWCPVLCMYTRLATHGLLPHRLHHPWIVASHHPWPPALAAIASSLSWPLSTCGPSDPWPRPWHCIFHPCHRRLPLPPCVLQRSPILAFPALSSEMLWASCLGPSTSLLLSLPRHH